MPHSWLSGSSASPHGSSAFFRLPAWFPVHSVRFFSTRLSVCFLSSFPASLPQLFHRCSPFSVFQLPLGVFLAIPFLSSGSRLGFDYSAFCSSVPFLPVFPHSGSFRCRFILSISADLFSLQPVTSFPFQLWYLAFLQFLFPLLCFASQVLLQFPASCFQLGRNLSFRLRLGNWRVRCTLKTEHC